MQVSAKRAKALFVGVIAADGKMASIVATTVWN
jgi:hypothetical protein